MIVIADAGSTKTDWRKIDNSGNCQVLFTIGFNPVLTTAELIFKELSKTFTNKAENQLVKAVYYYGAGCWDEASCMIVHQAIKLIFPEAAIWVTNDLLGAARSICGKQAGIACILGTGANSCEYDGEEIVDNVPALGFIMGDEGSGAYLGKQLLKHFFYRELPPDILEKLEKNHTISKKIILEKVYGSPNGNQYLAKFAKFIVAEKEHPFIKNLIKSSFNEFIKRQVLKYKTANSLPIHFVGSIALLLKEILEEVVSKNGLVLGNIIRQPIDGLVDYHFKKGYN